MEFSEIFLDLVEQSERANRAFTTRITRSMTESPENLDRDQAWCASREQPSPESLGDFLKLIGNPDEGSAMTHHAADIIVRTMENESVSEALLLVAGSMQNAYRYWNESYLGGELSKHGCDPSSPLRSGTTQNLFEGVVSRTMEKLSRVVKSAKNSTLPLVKVCGGTTLKSSLTGAGDESVFLGSATDQDLISDDVVASRDGSDGWMTENESSSESDEADSEVSVRRQAHRMLEMRVECERDERESLEWALMQARKTLALLYHGFFYGERKQDARSLIAELERDATPLLIRVILLLATMVGCQMPLSAAEWVAERFVPVKVIFPDFDTLGLLSIGTRGSNIYTGQKMQCFGRHLHGHDGTDLVIVDPTTEKPVGLLPDIANLPSELVEEGRGKFLYPSGVASINNMVKVVLPYMLGLEKITAD